MWCSDDVEWCSLHSIAAVNRCHKLKLRYSGGRVRFATKVFVCSVKNALNSIVVHEHTLLKCETLGLFSRIWLL